MQDVLKGILEVLKALFEATGAFLALLPLLLQKLPPKKKSKRRVLRFALTSVIIAVALVCSVRIIKVRMLNIHYVEDVTVSIYAGNPEGNFENYTFSGYLFASPQNLAFDGEVLYLSDIEPRGEKICILNDGLIQEIPVECRVDLMRVKEKDIYILTKPEQRTDGNYSFNLLHMNIHNGAIREMTEQPFLSDTLKAIDAPSMRITDFALSNDGQRLWFIQQDVSHGTFDLMYMTYNPENDCYIHQVLFKELPITAEQYGTLIPNLPRLVIDVKDNIYIIAPKDGVILRIKNGEKECSSFAGIAGERAFLDGSKPKFYEPIALSVSDDYLYVLDSGAIRRINLYGTREGFSETLAGQVLKNGDNPEPVPSESGINVEGRDSVFPVNFYSSMATDSNGHIFLSVNIEERGVVYQITTN